MGSAKITDAATFFPQIMRFKSCRCIERVVFQAPRPESKLSAAGAFQKCFEKGEENQDEDLVE
jgi:hypothetical protein